MICRTDMADELKNRLPAGFEGIKISEKEEEDIKISTVEVIDERGAKALGKPVGKYITITLPSVSYDVTPAEKRARIIGKELKKLLPEGLCLAVGLGNTSITPDALGPLTAKKILATRHVDEEIKENTGYEKLKPVAVISPGVLGKTGIETYEIIKSITEQIKPSSVLVIDAFASESTERLGKTVQLANTGICPGSGVGNRRREISEKSLGVPVISIGMPTVVDASSLAYNLLKDEAPEDIISPEGKEMFVTPREIDLIISRASEMISLAINGALQPDYSPEEIRILAS